MDLQQREGGKIVLRLIILLMILIPAIELWGLITVGKYIGALPTILIVIGTGILGGYLARQQGWQTFRLAQLEMNKGELPAAAILDGMCILAGGIMLITPGFFTDIVGLLLLIPFTRGMMKLWLKAVLMRKLRDGRFIWYRR